MVAERLGDPVGAALVQLILEMAGSQEVARHRDRAAGPLAQARPPPRELSAVRPWRTRARTGHAKLLGQQVRLLRTARGGLLDRDEPAAASTTGVPAGTPASASRAVSAVSSSSSGPSGPATRAPGTTPPRRVMSAVR